MFFSPSGSILTHWIVVTLLLLPSNAATETPDLILEEEIRRTIFENYSIHQRPVNSSFNAVTIHLAFTFVAILQLIDRDQVLTSTSYLQLRWTDQRLTWDPEDYGGIELIPIKTKEVWLPKLMLINSMESDEVLDRESGQIILQNDGEINLEAPIKLATLCPLDVTYFPYDMQICPFYFGLQNLPTNFAQLNVSGAYSVSHDASTQWEVTAVTGFKSTSLLANATSKIRDAEKSVVTFCVHFKRFGNFYVITLMVPSTLLSFIAYMTFLAPTDCGERLSVTVSMVLGLTVFQLLMSDFLPITNEPSILGMYLFINFIFVVLTVPLSLKNMNYAYGDTKIVILKNRWLRLLFLEYLPRLVIVPTLSKRLQKSVKSSSVDPRPVIVGNESDATNKWEDKERQPEIKDEAITKEEDILECRTIALVADRLTFFVLCVVHLTRTILMMLDFRRQEENLQINHNLLF